MPLRDREAGSGYRQVLRTGAAVRPFAATVVARLPISMAPIGALLLVQQVHGSYGFAGTVTAAFALGTALGGPGWARLMSRWGQSPVVAGTSVASGALLAALALATVAGAGSAALVVLAALCGTTFPPVGPAMRAAWRAVLPEGPARDAGYALDAVAVEAIFVGGPLLLSLMLPLTAPAVPLLVTAGLLAVGGVVFSLSSAARTAGHRDGDADDQDDADHPVTGPRGPGRAGLVVVLAVCAAMSVGFGHLDTSMAATARTVLDDQALLGLLFTAIAGGSVVGGLVYGSRRWPGRPTTQQTALLAVFATALTPVALLLLRAHVSLGALMPLLFLAGLPIAPSLIIQQHLVDDLSGPRRASVGQAWLTSASTTGGAAGTAMCGGLIDAHGVAWGFTGAVAGAALAALVSRHPALRRPRA